MVLNPNATKEGLTGFWLKAEEAANCGFAVGDSGWGLPEWFEETSASFKRAQEGEAGFCSQRFRGIVLHNSRRVIQRQTEQGWISCGAWDECPEEQKLIEQRSSVVRVRSYYLILLVNEKNEPIHDNPLLLSLGVGPGAAIGSFLFGRNGYFQEVNQAMVTRREKRLSRKGQIGIVVDFTLGETDTGGAAFMAPVAGVKPSGKQDNLEEITEKSYGDRQVVRQEVPIEELLIPPEHKDWLSKVWEQYKDWIPQRYYKNKPQQDNSSSQQSTKTMEEVESDSQIVGTTKEVEPALKLEEVAGDDIPF